jgi:hypothetical protein
MDNHADTICLGANCMPIYFTGELCDVAPYTDTYKLKKDIPVAQAATAYTYPETGETIIFILNQGLWFGAELPHSLWNPNQIRNFGHPLCDDPYDPHRKLGLMIDGREDKFIPFDIFGSSIGLKTRVPTEDEYRTCTHYVLSSEARWDPEEVLSGTQGDPERARLIESVRIDENVMDASPREPQIPCSDSEVDILMTSVSSAYNDGTLLSRLISAVKIMNYFEPNEYEKEEVKEDTKMPSIGATNTKSRHYRVTPDILAQRFDCGLETARKTLAATSQYGVRQATHPLTRRYRTDLLQLKYHRLSDEWYTDAMFPDVQSIRGDKAAQVYTNGDFIWVYPMKLKSETGESLQVFSEDVGLPRKLIFDGAAEQMGFNTDFMKRIRWSHIKWKCTEPHSPWQNRAEDAIRELKRRLRKRRRRRNIPRRLWSYLVLYEVGVMNFTVRGRTERTPYERVTGDTPDISEYVDFEFYDNVWWYDQAGDEENPYIGKWLGPSHRIGSPMCYWILKSNGEVVSRSTVQRITTEDLMSDNIQQRIKEMDEQINLRLKDEGFELAETNENQLFQEDLAGDDEVAFADGIEPMIDEDNKEYTPDAYDPYIGTEILIAHGDQADRARVSKRIKANDGTPIGMSNSNPLLDTRLYSVEFSDGEVAEIQANIIAENMFAQVDSEGREQMLLHEIKGHRKDDSALTKENGYRLGRGGNKIRKRTTKGWQFELQWKDGSTSWMNMQELLDSSPVELAEYAVAASIADEPAFAWWISGVLRKRNRIIAKVKSRYWKTTHKFGIQMPKTVSEAYEIDRITGTNHWTLAIEKEMRKIRELGAFEKWNKGTPEDLRSGKQKLPGFEEIGCHMVFDIKMDGKFTRKARYVANGNETEPPTAQTYASVVSRDSVRIALLYAALNDLDVLSCDVTNAYLNAECREKIWVQAGPEFGEDEGMVMIIRKALYGLKSSGASWRNMISQTMKDAGYQNTYADPDVWRRRAVKKDGTHYYELVLVYVDDIMSISECPQKTMDMIGKMYDLKDSVGQPERYLGVNLRKWMLPDGREVWSSSGKDYIKNTLPLVKSMAEARHTKLPGGKRAERPYPKTYKAELDTTNLLNDEEASEYQQMIGILRWAVELGRIDIALEVSLLSSYLCAPRKGHMEAVYNIFAYLDKHLESNLVFDDKIPSVDEEVFTKTNWADSVYETELPAAPPNMPEPLGNPVVISVFVDADHAGNVVTRRSQTGILIYVNNAPIIWYTKKQNTVEAATYGSEFVAARISVDLAEGLLYKLRMFGIPVELPINLFCDNRSVVNSSTRLEARLTKKHLGVCFHRIREACANGLARMGKEDGLTNLSDLLTKLVDTPKRRSILQLIFLKGG